MEEGGSTNVQPNSQPVEGQNELAEITTNRYETEESAVFVDYQVKSLEENTQNYNSLNIYKRTSLAKNIDSVRELLYPSSDYFNWLQLLAADNEDIQRCLLNFLRDSALSMTSSEHFRVEFIVPLTKIAVGSHLELKEQSCSLLCQILSNRRDLIKQIVELTYNLAKQEGQQNQMTCLYLGSGLMPLVEEQERTKLFQICCCSPYPKGSVKFKKQIIQYLDLFAKGQTSKFVDEEIIGGFFMERCKEPIWAIRKVCAQVLPKILSYSKSKKQTLNSCLFGFIKDGSKIVRLAAFKKVPQFLANYGSQDIPQNLFELYCSLPTHQINKQLSRDTQILQKVAFYFPGVVQVCGVNKWKKLDEIMGRLLYNKSKEIKVPLACSLHELARTLKPPIADKYLFPVVDQLLKEQNEEIRLAVVRIFSSFLESFDQKARQTLIDFFLVLQKDSKRWRIRNQIARQLGKLAKLYSSDINFQYIFPITLKLCNDSHNQVRMEAASHIHEVVLQMQSDKEIQDIAIESILHLGESNVYLQRLNFCFMVKNMLELASFRSKSNTVLLTLANDRIVGVRAALACSIKCWLSNKEVKEILQPVIDVLANDTQECVSEQVKEEQ